VWLITLLLLLLFPLFKPRYHILILYPSRVRVKSALKYTSIFSPTLPIVTSASRIYQLEPWKNHSFFSRLYLSSDETASRSKAPKLKKVIIEMNRSDKENKWATY
jgi:hypothetical protein